MPSKVPLPACKRACMRPCMRARVQWPLAGAAGHVVGTHLAAAQGHDALANTDGGRSLTPCLAHPVPAAAQPLPLAGPTAGAAAAAAAAAALVGQVGLLP